MLLFTVELKPNLKQIAQPQVIGGTIVHFLISVGLFAQALYWRLAWPGLAWNAAILIAIALAFSSTVLTAKLVEGKHELRAFHGRTAISVLIVKDIIALIVPGVWSGKTTNLFALLLFALPLLRPMLHQLLDLAGHDELLWY